MNMYELLEQKLANNKLSWYILSVTFGKEAEIKKKLMNLEDSLDLVDVIAPEPLKDKENDIYKYFLGYAFIQTTLNVSKYGRIIELEHIFRFLGSVAEITKKQHLYLPYKIPDKQMVNVKDFLTGKRTLETVNEFNVDDKVIIAKGDLATIKGKIIEINKKDAKILPETFFQNVIVVPLASLARCE